MTVAARRIPNGVAQTAHSSPKRPVAGYLRSATQLEGDSLRNQLEAVVRYARDRNMQLVRIYCDECGSGLRIDGRPGLGQLLRDVESGAGDFEAVLLLDPSRWSRSLNPNHVWFLENRCSENGIAVHYCAEGLSDEDTSISAIVKAIKRQMVRGYSRYLTDSTWPRTRLRKAAIAAGRCRSAADRLAGQNSVPDDAHDADHTRPATD